jgi:hypothetical protein
MAEAFGPPGRPGRRRVIESMARAWAKKVKRSARRRGRSFMDAEE